MGTLAKGNICAHGGAFRALPPVKRRPRASAHGSTLNRFSYTPSLACRSADYPVLSVAQPAARQHPKVAGGPGSGWRTFVRLRRNRSRPAPLHLLWLPLCSAGWRGIRGSRCHLQHQKRFPRKVASAPIAWPIFLKVDRPSRRPSPTARHHPAPSSRANLLRSAVWTITERGGRPTAESWAIYGHGPLGWPPAVGSTVPSPVAAAVIHYDFD